MKRFAALLLLAAICGCHRPVTVPKVPLADLRKEVDPAVRWNPASVPDEKNGWLLFVRALRSRYPEIESSDKEPIRLEQLYDELINAKPKLDNLSHAEACLQPFKGKIDLLRQAVAKPTWSAWQPGQIKRPITLTYRLSGVLLLNKALAVQSWSSYFKRDRKAIRENLLLQLRFGKRLIQAHDEMIGPLHGVLVLGIACGTARSLSAHGALDATDLKALIDELSMSDLSDDFFDSMKVEFDHRFVNGIADLTFPTNSPALIDNSRSTIEEALLDRCKDPLDRKATVREASTYLAAVISNLKSETGKKIALPTLPDAQALGWPHGLIGSGWPLEKGLFSTRPFLMDAAEVRLCSKKLATQANPVGKLIVSFQMPSYAKYAARLADLRAVQRYAQIWMASEIFRREQGAFPRTVEDLAAKGYLKSVPTNPKTGKAYKLSDVN